ncbi:MAG TPA: porin family protein [Vicinamibacterales bacterium]|nr:porin family protein [Vicinamibacterales bacterium]
MYRLRFALLLLATLGCATPAAAQAVIARGGVDFTNASFDETDTSAEPGFVGGVAVRFGTGRTTLQVEGLFAQKRISFSTNLIEDHIWYLEVPALIRYGLWKSAAGRTAQVFGGGVAGFRLAASEKVGDESSTDIKDALKSVTGGIVVGGDVQITGLWSVDVRYTFGLSGAYNTLDGGSAGKLNTLQATLGYRIR